LNFYSETPLFDAIRMYIIGNTGVKKIENIKFIQKPKRVLLPSNPTTKHKNK